MCAKPVNTAAKSLPEGGKARRVYLQLLDGITRGTYPDGAALPAEHRLCVELGVARVTLRRALDALEAEGLIDRRAGAGTRVRTPQQKPKMAADFSTLMPQLVQMGHETTARLLSFRYGVPPAAVASAMRI